MKDTLKIIFCWSDISGYMVSCWKALDQLEDINLRIYAFGNNHQTNFDLGLTEALDITWVSRNPDSEQLTLEISNLKPDVIVLCGWFVPAYRKLAYSNTFSKTKFILAMDTPWWGTPKQMIGQYLLNGFVKKMSAVVTSGERSYQYARRLGAKKIAKIQYGVNVEKFSQSFNQRTKNPWPKSFLYIGRYSEEKGIDILISAFLSYKLNSKSPWKLTCCGKGELEHLLSEELIDNKGFVQPNEMNSVWENAGCLILPSSFDPWPLTIVEACAAGLPVICTHESGSQVEVVKVYWNGLIIPANDTDELVKAMLWIENNYSILPEMGHNSINQALPYSANEWSKKLLHLINSIH